MLYRKTRKETIVPTMGTTNITGKARLCYATSLGFASIDKTDGLLVRTYPDAAGYQAPEFFRSI